MTEADLKQHRIEYWLNQIELWFRILMRRLLKRGNFPSVEVVLPETSEKYCI
jgi:hypothetical protein